ncbi:hypothetical protein ES288_A03G142000v1 [Gossypium darwinii]|uniref:Uncharacterized protein n=1 Tax=Gossypium darwinii TaxID=34276 RepID=A0A5D2H4J6_GOSDA|nr:hypothetical protein ES288_A03G142000v1 [Gossypium darwinii]
MESTKRKGFFFKGKLAKSLSRVTKPRATTAHQQCSKVVPYSYANSNQPTDSHEQMNVPSSMLKVSYARLIRPPSFYDQNMYANERWGVGDENVDFKATSIISIVRERFNLDRVY